MEPPLNLQMKGTAFEVRRQTYQAKSWDFYLLFMKTAQYYLQSFCHNTLLSQKITTIAERCDVIATFG